MWVLPPRISGFLGPHAGLGGAGIVNPVAGRVVGIVNPASGGGRTNRRMPGIKQRLRNKFPHVRLRYTTGPGHATEMCREALEAGAEVIVSIGGDGTNNEVLGGFVDAAGKNRFPDAVLGLAASGTGSDFQRHLRSLGDLAEAASPRRVDYGVVRFVDHHGQPGVRVFLNEVSAGISGCVTQVAQGSSYVWGSLRAIWTYRNRVVRISVDKGPPREVDLTLVVAANGAYFGGGMHVAPAARCDDGRLELLVASGLGRVGLVRLLGRIFSGRHIGHPAVTTTAARRSRWEPVGAGPPVWLDVDGEQPGRLPAEVEIVPGGIWVLGGWE